MARVARAALGMVGVTLLVGALGDCDGCADDATSTSTGGAGAPPTTTASTTSHTVVTTTSSGGQGGATPCPAGQLPPGVPEGWIRMPAAPCDCDVYMAPDAEHTTPVSWASCGDGCTELVVDWSTDEVYRALVQGGGAGNGQKWVAFTRYFGAALHHELQIVRLPDSEVLLDAIYQDPAEGWRAMPRALTRAGHLVELAGPGNAQSFEHPTVWYLVSANGMTLEPVLSGIIPWAMLEATVSTELWAVEYQGAMAWGWHERAFDSDMKPGWSSPDGRSMFGIEAVGRNVFFSTWRGDVLSQIEVWSELQGAAPFVSYPSKADGGACCFETDGETMVWFEATGYLGDERYASVHLMKAPVATSAAALSPEVVRPAYQDTVVRGGGVVGGGYAAHHERPIGASLDEDRLIVTRLSDGFYWVLPPREGMRWDALLYIDAEEVAIGESRAPGTYHATHWGIVRRSIASLGEPLAPGSGF